jgi:hypothetical protein
MSIIPNRPSGGGNRFTDAELALLAHHGYWNSATIPKNVYVANGQVWEIVDVNSPSAGRVNAAARPVEWSARSIAGANAVIPIVYGTPVRVGLAIVGLIVQAGFLNILGVIGHGELELLSTLEMDGKGYAPAELNAQFYTGTPTQTVDPSSVVAYASVGVTFADAMPDVAYVRLSLPPTLKLNAFPNISATVAGRKVFDPRSNTTVFSANPALCLADFITNDKFGAGRLVDQASLIDAANFCDEDVDGQRRKQIAIAFVESQKVEDIIAHMQAYTGCALWERGGVYYFKPLRRSTPSRLVSYGDMLQGSLKISRARLRDIPTDVGIAYTDVSVPENFQTRRQYAPRVATGAGRRESVLAMPGITRPEQAARDALERQNQFTVATTELAWAAFDPGMELQQAEVVTVQLPDYGINAPFRLTRVADQGFGRWSIEAESYADSIYDGVAIVDPPPLNPGGMIPTLDPPVMVPPVNVREVSTLQGDGTWLSQLAFDWARPTQAHSAFQTTLYNVTNPAAQVVVDSRTTALPSFQSYPLAVGGTYYLSVRAISPSGAVSNEVTSTPFTVVGKDVPPGDVPAFFAVEAGGDVFMNWTRPTDPDLAGFEIRRGVPGATWAQMVPVTDVDANSFVAFNQPEGVWDYSIRARDTAGQLSARDTRQRVTVAHDGGQIITRGPWPFAPYTSQNFDQWTAGGVVYMVNTNPAGLWGDGADNPDNAVGRFDDSLKDTIIALPSTVPAWIESGPIDVGQIMAGDWQLLGNIEVIGGPSNGYRLKLLLADTQAGPFTEVPSLTGSGRWAKLRIEVDAGTIVRTTQTWQLLYSTVPTIESGTVDVPAGGAAIVPLVNRYSSWESAFASIIGDGASTAVYSRVDNIVIGGGVPNTITVKLFNSAGQPTSGRASWQFKGL